jgi:hypothetical protein
MAELDAAEKADADAESGSLSGTAAKAKAERDDKKRKAAAESSREKEATVKGPAESILEPIPVATSSDGDDKVR